MKPLHHLACALALVPFIGCIPLPAEMFNQAAKKATNTAGGSSAGGVEVVTAVPPPPPGQGAPAGVAPGGVTPSNPMSASSAPAGVIVPTSASAPTSGRLWVVVKNLRISGVGISSEITADWEVVQGSPEPGAKYVLRVSDGESGSMIERYVDFDIDLSQRKGSVSEGVRGMTFGIRGGIIAVVGKTRGFGRDELEEVSGRCRIGGQSEATAPPTVVEAAGAAAKGMAIAIANPRHEGRGIGAPRGGWSVDYKVQGGLSPGERYFWIVEDGSGGGVEFDVTSDLAFPGRASEGTLSGTSFGPGRLGGQLKMYIERRGFGFGGTKTVVSNTVTLN
jgi:hypothetical protein